MARFFQGHLVKVAAWLPLVKVKIAQVLMQLFDLTFGELTGTLGMVNLVIRGRLVSRCRTLVVGMRFLTRQLLMTVAR